jgi:hypothetical protein
MGRDRRVWGGVFGHEAHGYCIPDDLRERLSEILDTRFTDDDFAEMAEALEACHSAWLAKQHSPSANALADRIDEIARAAEALRDDLLSPHLTAPDGKPRDAINEEAAGRVVARLAQLWSAPHALEAAESGLTEEGRRRVEEFHAALSDVVAAAEEIKALIDSDGITTRQRVGVYIRFLIDGLKPILVRHKLSTRWSGSVAGQEEAAGGRKLRSNLSRIGPSKGPRSYLGLLAFEVGQLLPRGARPQSVAGVVEHIREHRGGRERKRVGQSRPPRKK